MTEQYTIDWKGGEVVWDSLKGEDVFGNPKEMHLSEDLILVKYPGYSIDVGWYGSEAFSIYVIGEAGWDVPLYSAVAVTFPEMFEKLQEVIDRMKRFGPTA